jgi:hypothetical protein
LGRIAAAIDRGGDVGQGISRREAVTGAAAGAAVIGVGAAGTASAGASESVRGSWRITPELPEGVPAFVALAAFGAGGIFVTTGSDEPGTGIGQWASRGRRGFTFAYTNFHFDNSGRLNNTVHVTATGTFTRRRMTGTAELRRVDADGNPIGSPQTTPFTGRRMPAS